MTTSSPTRNALLLLFAVVLVASISYIATISHADSPRPTIMAGAITLFGVIPPLYLGQALPNAAARQLAVVAWRMAIMLPSVIVATRFEDHERNCFLTALLACYFVALVLESWLLIRGAE